MSVVAGLVEPIREAKQLFDNFASDLFARQELPWLLFIYPAQLAAKIQGRAVVTLGHHRWLAHIHHAFALKVYPAVVFSDFQLHIIDDVQVKLRPRDSQRHATVPYHTDEARVVRLVSVLETQVRFVRDILRLVLQALQQVFNRRLDVLFYPFSDREIAVLGPASDPALP
jgi:hypothetical protein